MNAWDEFGLDTHKIGFGVSVSTPALFGGGGWLGFFFSDKGFGITISGHLGLSGGASLRAPLYQWSSSDSKEGFDKGGYGNANGGGGPWVGIEESLNANHEPTTTIQTGPGAGVSAEMGGYAEYNFYLMKTKNADPFTGATYSQNSHNTITSVQYDENDSPKEEK